MTYPNDIPPVEQCENIAVHDALVTLGINPQGAQSTVAARMAQMDTQLLKERAFRMDAYPTPQAAIDAAFAAGGGFGFALTWRLRGPCWPLAPGAQNLGPGGMRRYGPDRDTEAL